MKILMVSSESNPFAKTGGLADVVYSLSKELVILGHETSIVMPLYKRIKEKYNSELNFIDSFYIDMHNDHLYCGIYDIKKDGIRYLFIDNEEFFNRDGLYGYDDDARRFAFFDLSVSTMIGYLHLNLDIVHVHDHQAGMIPFLIKYCYFYNIHTVLTIHNPAFQGMFDPYRLGELFNLDRTYYDNGLLRFENQVSFLKAGIMTADMITTVSPNHRDELMNGMYDYNLHQVLKFRDKDFVGIINGLDYQEFNPINDKLIPYNFDDASLENKKKCKEEFCLKYGFDKNLPLYGLVSRLTSQKGIELLLDALPEFTSDINVFILGSGDPALEYKVEKLVRRFKNIKSYIGYSDSLAHNVYASSDFFFMPSLYEPCGIGQMIAHRYGSIPIVRTTGGLKDTVIDDVDGITFNYFDNFAMNYAITKSLNIYNDKKLMKKMIKNSLNKDHKWISSAKKYVEVYEKALNK